MNAKQYQEQAARTLISDPGEFTHQELMTIWGVIGLAGEAGEVAEMVKKGIFHRHGLEREKLVKELGDVAWYLASICTVQGIDLGEVMQANIDKLKLRYPDGFSTADSMKRIDVESDFDICECGHSRKHHPEDKSKQSMCVRIVSSGIGQCDIYCACMKFTLAATIAHDEPAEMCADCGHEKTLHDGTSGCLSLSFCECQRYTPIPALLRGEQPPLFDTDK